MAAVKRGRDRFSAAANPRPAGAQNDRFSVGADIHEAPSALRASACASLQSSCASDNSSLHIQSVHDNALSDAKMMESTSIVACPSSAPHTEEAILAASVAPSVLTPARLHIAALQSPPTLLLTPVISTLGSQLQEVSSGETRFVSIRASIVDTGNSTMTTICSFS